MNLRWVHATLILLASLLAVLFGVWCLGQDARESSGWSLLAAIMAFAASLGLIAYDAWFLRNTRTLP